DSKKMYSANFFGSYKWILGGVGIDQNPVLRTTNGDVEMSKVGITYLSLGAKKDIELPTKKPTTLKMKSWVKYPLSAMSENTDVKVDSVSGFGITGQVELNRQIFSKKDYSLHATWLTQAGFQKINQ